MYTKETMFMRPPAPECFDCGDEGIVRDYSADDGAGLCRCARRCAPMAPEPASFACAGFDPSEDSLPF